MITRRSFIGCLIAAVPLVRRIIPVMMWEMTITTAAFPPVILRRYADGSFRAWWGGDPARVWKSITGPYWISGRTVDALLSCAFVPDGENAIFLRYLEMRRPIDGALSGIGRTVDGRAIGWRIDDGLSSGGVG